MMNHQIKLPFSENALSPYISEETMDLHYNKHHRGYAEKLQELIAHTQYQEMSLEDIIETSFNKKDMAIYNNAAQTWNHNFYWKSLCPIQESFQPIEGDFFTAITLAGGFDVLFEKMVAVGVQQFASGWAWLVRTQEGIIDVRKTGNADPIGLHSSDCPLLVLDVWEHAYYVDYRNRRGEHLQALRPIIHWSFAQDQFLKIDILFSKKKEDVI